MFIILLSTILNVNAEQAVIQYDTIKPGHFAPPHVNNLHLEKHLVIVPKVSHGMEYLENLFRREMDAFPTNNNILNGVKPAKPVTETSEETPATTAPIAEAVPATPTQGIFNHLNLNYEIPTYSLPGDFQDSVNTLTHMMINKQTKFPGTNYGVPVTDTPEHIKSSTIKAFANMWFGSDKQQKQSDMLNQILDFMHKKKIHQEQQALIAQLQQQLQKKESKSVGSTYDQAEGFIKFMQELFGPLKQQGLGDLPVGSTTFPVSNFVTYVPQAQLDLTVAKPSYVAEVQAVPTSIPGVIQDQPVQHQLIPSLPTTPVLPSPTKPTIIAVPFETEEQTKLISDTLPFGNHPIESNLQASNPKEGYLIHLSKPTFVKDKDPLSTSMPKIVHQYMQPAFCDTFSKSEYDSYFHTSPSSSMGLSHSDFQKDFLKPSHLHHSHSVAHSRKRPHKELSFNADIFEPKYEHYIMEERGEKTKSQLIKLKEEYKHHDTKQTPKHHFNIHQIDAEFSNGLNGANHHDHSVKHDPYSNKNNHEVVRAHDLDVDHFSNNHNDYKHGLHSHTPFMTYNNHEFDEEFLNDNNGMHFTSENESGEAKKPVQMKRIPPQKPILQQIIVLKKTSKS